MFSSILSYFQIDPNKFSWLDDWESTLYFTHTWALHFAPVSKIFHAAPEHAYFLTFLLFADFSVTLLEDVLWILYHRFLTPSDSKYPHLSLSFLIGRGRGTGWKTIRLFTQTSSTGDRLKQVTP